jgi:hypothetical protein
MAGGGDVCVCVCVCVCVQVDAGLLPAVAGMLRVSRSDAAWGACVGLLNNVCLISQVNESSHHAGSASPQ